MTSEFADVQRKGSGFILKSPNVRDSQLYRCERLKIRITGWVISWLKLNSWSCLTWPNKRLPTLPPEDRNRKPCREITRRCVKTRNVVTFECTSQKWQRSVRWNTKHVCWQVFSGRTVISIAESWTVTLCPEVGASVGVLTMCELHGCHAVFSCDIRILVREKKRALTKSVTL